MKKIISLLTFSLILLPYACKADESPDNIVFESPGTIALPKAPDTLQDNNDSEESEAPERPSLIKDLKRNNDQPSVMKFLEHGSEIYHELSLDSLYRYYVLAPAFLFHIAVSARIIKRYESLLNKYPHLMEYLPAIMCAGGGASSQASTQIIEQMASDLVKHNDFWHVIEKESIKASLLGIGLGATFLVVPFTGLNIREKLSISLPLAAIITFAGLLGASMPFSLNQLGINPAQAAGPILTTAIDVAGIYILFLVGLRFMEYGTQRLHHD